MIRNRKILRISLICIVLASVMFLSSCSSKDKTINPSEWGYDCVVIYNALGGVINSREIRETYYMKNSYLFEPSGSTNMLIKPVKDGYLLAGWYTAKEDILDDEGNVIGYSFKAEDRWDFDEDRVQEDMTLYARWVPQGKIEYIDAETDEVLFTKNISEDSAVQPLSSAVESLIAKSGYTFEGYYANKELTIPYDFSEYVHAELIPSDEEVYEELYQQFPEYIRKIEYVEPDEDEINPELDTSDLFINKLGYEITTDDKEIRAQIRKYKDEIYERAINYYIENSSSKRIYLKYTKGSYARISKADDLKYNGKTWFSGYDRNGNAVEGYILTNDIDFSGITVAMAESYSGKIIGNGFSLKNITFAATSKKIDVDTSKSLSLFNKLEGAYIENLTFENMTIKLNVNSGIPVTAAPIALEARNTELKNVHFEGLTIDTGNGDDGTAKYAIGDVFVSGRNNKLDNVTGSNVTIKVSEHAQVNILLEEK